MSGRLSLTQAFVFLLRRDLLLAVRNRGEYVMPLLFFVLVTTLFPLALGALPELLARIAPGVIWVSALLAAMLSLNSIFRSDFDDGSLEQILLSAHPVSVLVLAKVVAHWLVTGLPLLLIAPVLAQMLGMPDEALGMLLLTILLGTPVLSLIGAIGVALTVGLRKGGIILSLLVLPLYVPVLIFAASAVENAAMDLTFPHSCTCCWLFYYWRYRSRPGPRRRRCACRPARCAGCFSGSTNWVRPRISTASPENGFRG